MLFVWIPCVSTTTLQATVFLYKIMLFIFIALYHCITDCLFSFVVVVVIFFFGRARLQNHFFDHSIVLKVVVDPLYQNLQFVYKRFYKWLGL